MRLKIGIGAVALASALCMNVCAADISGTWQYVLTNPQGTFHQRFILKQEGEKITGQIFSPQGKEQQIQSGHVNSNQITFDVIRRSAGGDKATTVTYKATVTGDEMKGYFIGPGGHHQEWTAKRQVRR